MQLKEFASKHAGELGTSERAVKQSIEAGEANIAWMEAYYEVNIAWIC